MDYIMKKMKKRLNKEIHSRMLTVGQASDLGNRKNEFLHEIIYQKKI